MVEMRLPGQYTAAVVKQLRDDLRTAEKRLAIAEQRIAVLSASPPRLMTVCHICNAAPAPSPLPPEPRPRPLPSLPFRKS